MKGLDLVNDLIADFVETINRMSDAGQLIDLKENLNNFRRERLTQ